jgi:hypothetical protein
MLVGLQSAVCFPLAWIAIAYSEEKSYATQLPNLKIVLLRFPPALP